MKKLISPENGFSLVQGMIMAAILAASALVATRLLTDQKMAQKSMETRDQIEDLHTIIYSTLQKRENCEATFTGNLAAPVINTLKNAPAIDPIQTIRLPITGEVVARVFNGTLNVTDGGRNTYMNGNVLIQSMNLTYAELPNSTANLEIVYERLANQNTPAGSAKRTKVGYGAKTIKKNITIRVQRNPFDLPNKSFVSCYALTTDKGDGSSEIGNDINEEFCKDMNNNLEGDGTITGLNVFLWDPTTNTCIPNAKCPDHQVYTGFTATGTVICKTLSQLIQERPALWNSIYTGTTGTCGPNKTIRIVPSTDARTISINCN